MVLGVISNKGDVMTLHIFSKNVRVNTDMCMDFRKALSQSWLDQIARNWHYIILQEGVPTHKTKNTQYRLKENLPEVWEKEVWPPKLSRLRSFGLFYAWRF